MREAFCVGSNKYTGTMSGVCVWPPTGCAVAFRICGTRKELTMHDMLLLIGVLVFVALLVLIWYTTRQRKESPMNRSEDYLTFDHRKAPPIIRLKGHRIGIEHIVPLYWGGHTIAEISHNFEVDETLIHAAVTYADQHPTEVAAIIARHEEIGAAAAAEQEAHPPAVLQRLRSIRPRLPR